MCDTAASQPRRLLRISYVLCMWHVETRLPSWRTRRLDIYLFFQTTHVYDEKFPIPTTLVCMRAKKIPKGRAAAGVAWRGVPPPLVHSNKERLGAKRGLFCARRCSGMCAIALYYYTHHDRHSCPIQKLRVIAQASLHSAHDGVMLDKPQDYNLWKIDEYYFKKQSLKDLTITRIPRLVYFWITHI